MEEYSRENQVWQRQMLNGNATIQREEKQKQTWEQNNMS